MTPLVRAAVVFVAWFLWAMVFVVRGKRHHQKAVQVDARARWGLALEMAGYFVAFTHGPEVWSSPLEMWRAASGIVLAVLSIALAWGAIANLGDQWRVDAGLNQDHELVQTGAYRIVRHPIYASMMGMLLATLCWAGSWPGWPIAIALFIAGTEIRVRVEDGLLRERFGERFLQWQRSVPAYLPLVR